jgi:hypothetical protein
MHLKARWLRQVLTPRGLWTRVTVGLLVAAASLAIGWVPATRFTAAAVASSDFSGLAAANGVRVSYEIKGFLVVDYIADLGATTAQASVDSLDSTGFAAEPYPGSTVLAGPGTVLGGAPAPVSGNPPSYPLIAQSSPANPASSVQQGPLDLESKSDQTSSSAIASVAAENSGGNTLGSSVSTADVTYDTSSGSVKSTAVSETQPSSFAGGVLVVGHTRASAEADGPGSGGPPARNSSFEADGVTVAGQAISVTPSGLTLPGSSVPLPATDPLNQALSAANLKIQYVSPQEIGDQVQSAGIVISQTEPIPNSPNPGVLTFTFGEAHAAAQGGTDLALSQTGLSSVGGNDFTPGTPVSAVSGSSGAGAAPAVGSASTTPLASPPVPGTPPSVASPTNRGAPVTRLGRTSRAVAQDRQQFGAAFYLILVLASVLAFGAIQFVRYFAVRLAWN